MEYLILLIVGMMMLYTFPSDPDFGWHLMAGKEVLEGGVASTDPFSYTMPSYPFVDHEWLTNILMALAYPTIRERGMSLFFTLIAIFALVLTIRNPLSRKFEREYFKEKFILLFGLGCGVLLPYFGVRPQVQSWLFLAILLRIVLNVSVWKKLRFILPVLMVAWVNLHGSFAEGVFVVIVVIAARSLRFKKIDYKDLFSVVLVVFATFLNPYTFRIWWEVWMQITDSSLRWSINEWQPALFSVHFSYIILLGLSLGLLYIYRNKFLLEEKVLYLFLLVQGLSSTRHVPLWSILALPMLSVSIDYLITEIKNIPFAKVRLKKVYILLLALTIVILFFEIYNGVSASRKLGEAEFYPKGAVEYLKAKNYDGNIFSTYGWGGYLIWRYPEKKVFIDGRMPSWRREDVPNGELASAFDTYKMILSGEEDYQVVFNNYNIKVVLWSKNEKLALSKAEKKVRELFKWLNTNFSDFNLLQDIKNSGWKMVYEDEVATIYIINE